MSDSARKGSVPFKPCRVDFSGCPTPSACADQGSCERTRKTRVRTRVALYRSLRRKGWTMRKAAWYVAPGRHRAQIAALAALRGRP